MRMIIGVALLALGVTGCVKGTEDARPGSATPRAEQKQATDVPGEAPEQGPAPVAARRFWPLTREAAPQTEAGTPWHRGAAARRWAYTKSYSRTLRTVLLERAFRWQSRHLVDGLQRDLGLRFRGWYEDAQEGWVQPTSLFSDPQGGKLDPIRRPLLLEGTDRAWAVDTEQVDVLMIGDLGPDSFTRIDWGIIARFVMNGGGLVLLPGEELLVQAQNPEFRVLCPVVPNYRFVDHPEPGRVRYVAPGDVGEAHELLNLTNSEDADHALLGSQQQGVYRRGELDGVYWVAPVASVRPRASVLAWGVEEGQPVRSGMPLLVVQEVGQGRVVWVGTDDLWMWRQYVGDIYFYQFFQNVIRWAANDPGPG